MCVVFNAIVALFFMVIPQVYSVMFPKEIKAAAALYVEKKDGKLVHMVLYPLYLLI